MRAWARVTKLVPGVPTGGLLLHTAGMRKGFHTTTAPPGLPDGASSPPILPLSTPCQSIIGAMMFAKLFRARFSRLFTVPRLHCVMSAISS